MGSSNYSNPKYFVDVDTSEDFTGDLFDVSGFNTITATFFYEATTVGVMYADISVDTEANLLSQGSSGRWTNTASAVIDGSVETDSGLQINITGAQFMRFRWVGSSSTGNLTAQYGVKSYGS